MDPIHPIAPGPTRAPRVAVPRVERVSRERDGRPDSSEERKKKAEEREQERRRRESQQRHGDDGDDDGAPHIDVRA